MVALCAQELEIVRELHRVVPGYGMGFLPGTYPGTTPGINALMRQEC